MESLPLPFGVATLLPFLDVQRSIPASIRGRLRWSAISDELRTRNISLTPEQCEAFSSALEAAGVVLSPTDKSNTIYLAPNDTRCAVCDSTKLTLHLSRRTTPVRVLAFGQQPACKPYHFECNACGTLHLYNELRYFAFVVAVRLRDVHDVHSLALEGLLKLKLDNLGVTHEPQPARALVPQAGPKPAAASELAPQACTERSIAPLASRRRRQSLLASD